MRDVYVCLLFTLFSTNISSSLNYDFIFFNLPYGAAWRQRRRAFHEHFNCNAIQRYHQNQLRETRALLRNLLKNPDKFLRYLRL